MEAVWRAGGPINDGAREQVVGRRVLHPAVQLAQVIRADCRVYKLLLKGSSHEVKYGPTGGGQFFCE